MKIGRKVLFKKSELDTWIEAHRVTNLPKKPKKLKK